MKRPLAYASVLFILLIRGFYICFPPVLQDYTFLKGREVYVKGQIKSIQPQEYNDKVQILYTLEDVCLQETMPDHHSYHSEKNNSQNTDGQSSTVYKHGSIRCYGSQNDLQLNIGSTVWIKGLFMPFSAAQNPGEFDPRFYYHIQDVGGSIEAAQLVWSDYDKASVHNFLYFFKSKLLERVDVFFEPRYGGVIKTILLGDKADLADDLKTLYQESGILHILTISGMHISMLGMGSFRFLRKIGCPIKISAAAGFGIVLFYGIMIGTQAATFRAIVMFSLQMAAIILGRTYDRLTGIAAAAMMLLLEQPLYVFYGGFLLSFGAVLGITMAAPIMEKAGKGKGAAAEAFCKYFSGSIAILVTTFPIQIYFYYEYPLYSMAVNALVLPFLPYIVVFGVLVLFIPLQFGTLALPFVMAGQWLLDGYEWICTQSSRLPFHAIVIGAPNGGQIVLYYVCLFVMLDCMSGERLFKICTARHVQTKQKRKNKRNMIVVMSCLVYIFSAAILLWRPHRGLSCHFLSVGQGDCTVLRYQEQVYLVDGGSTSNSKIAEKIILPCLKYYGTAQVDGIFISHADADHMNGIIQWLENYEHSHVTIGRFILPALSEIVLAEEFGELLMLAEKRNIPISVLGAGKTLEIGDLSIDVLHPQEDYDNVKNTNGYSQVLLFSYDGNGILMTGDIASDQEKEILGRVQEDFMLQRKMEDFGTLVFKAPHHGSKYSSSEQFLNFLEPDCTIISYGIGNSYGHPHGEVLERLDKIETKVYKTAKSGMITVNMKDGEVRVVEFLPLTW